MKYDASDIERHIYTIMGGNTTFLINEFHRYTAEIERLNKLVEELSEENNKLKSKQTNIETIEKKQ